MKEIVNDKMHGEGKLTYQGIYEYNGEFKDGSFNGYGVLTRKDGFGHIIEKCDGKFENGKFIEGFLIKDINRGIWTGYRYEGNFEDSERNGNGQFISYYSGTVFEGTFQMDIVMVVALLHILMGVNIRVSGIIIILGGVGLIQK